MRACAQILCEVGAAATKLGPAVRDQLGARRLLVVTDKHLRSLGMLDAPLAALRAQGVDCVVYDDVLPDPPEANVHNACAMAREEKVDGVIGFGGGSSLDVAKVVAYLAGPSTQRLDEIFGVEQCTCPTRLPLVQVPTTAGTGSEVTAVSILTTGATTKMGVVSRVLLPDLALLDASLTVGLPKATTAATGLDAMVHATEAYTSRRLKNPLSDALAREALALLATNIRTAVHQGEDLQARGRMLLGSMYAGMAFANAPVAAVHALAYPLGGLFKLPHGLTCSLMFTPVMRFNAAVAQRPYAELADIVCPRGSIPAGASDTQKVDALIDAIATISQDIELPQTLREVGVSPTDVDRMAADAMLQTRLLVNNPVDVTEQDAAKLYASIGGW